MQSSTPECTHSGLASSAFARRYLRNRCFFLFLRLLRCFSSPGSLPCVMDWRMDDRSLSCRVSPFRHPRIMGYLLLPAAFRSLSRLSSALSAKASALCPSLFDLFVFFRHIALWRGPYSLILTVSRDSLFLMSFLLSDNRCFLYSMQFSRYNRQFYYLSGDNEIRTRDPLLARQVLSQLSYTPIIWRPPTLPYRHQYSTIGRLCLNHRVRDGNGCVPQAHRHRKSLSHLND